MSKSRFIFIMSLALNYLLLRRGGTQSDNQAEPLTQSRRYADALTRGQEAERARIAHELHDDTMQSLIAIAQSIELAQSWLEDEPQRARGTLKTARQGATDAVANLRTLIADLRPPALEELGLIPALKMFVERAPEIDVTLHLEGVERRLPEVTELTLFRVVQEAITNARRHGEATHIEVRLTYHADHMHLIVRDDGKGFTLPHTLEQFAGNGHFGLIGIQERVAHCGGQMRLTSAPEKGAELDVTIPTETGDLPAGLVIDPVCAMPLEPHQVYSSAVYEDARYYFCCPICERSFHENPEVYLTS